MHRHLQRAHDALVQSAGALALDELTRRPDGKWSPADILEHLGLTFSLTAKGLQRVLDGTVPPPGRPDLAQWLRIFVVVQCGYFPSGRVSPDRVAPRGCDPAGVLAATLASLKQMDGLLDAVAQARGRRKVLAHPILGPFSAGEWRKFHWVHTRHHACKIVERAQPRGGAAAP